jgi:D-alanyl-D-alanine carboxypeptidase
VKKSILCLLCLLFIHSSIVSASAVPSVYGDFAVVLDASTGEVLYDKNANQKAYPASLTKIMTAVILQMRVKDQEWMTASDKAVGQEASNAYFKLSKGEQIQKRDALNALMVISANDVAMTVAEHVGGTVEGFASLMNEEAKKIGMVHTHFVTPNGLHDSNHYTTAYDLGLLAKEAMKYPEIMKAMGSKEALIKTNLREIHIKNPSKIHDDPQNIGGKTGYTGAAQNTLIEYVQKDQKTVISVVLRSTKFKEYDDIRQMSAFAFENLKVEKIFTKGQQVGQENFHDEIIRGELSESFVLTTIKSYSMTFQDKVVFKSWGVDQKGVLKGDVIGAYQISKNGKIIKEIPIVSMDSSHPVEIVIKSTNKTYKYYSLIVVIGAVWAGLLLQKKRKIKRIMKLIKHGE